MWGSLTIPKGGLTISSGGLTCSGSGLTAALCHLRGSTVAV
jgi:hypothetical protein